MARYFAGIDGGGTRTTLALADADGRELARSTGPAGLVDPRRPAASAEVLAALVADTVRDAGLREPPAVLVAGLAGAGSAAEREAVRAALAASRVAAEVCVVTDGEIALEGALGGGAGVLLVAGTGSVAYGRGPDGRVERSGGWGMVVGDEGSGFAIGRAGLVAALRASDGRGPETRLLPLLLALLEVETTREIPPWAGRAEKAQVAALARHVIALARDGDAVAEALVTEQARELAAHAEALARRLAPWPDAVPVVFHGGALSTAHFAMRVEEALAASGQAFRVHPPVADAVAGALAFAARHDRPLQATA